MTRSLPLILAAAATLAASDAGAVWNLYGNVLSPQAGPQTSSVSVADGTGGFLVVWVEDGPNGTTNLRGAHVLGTGTVAWAQPICNALGSQTEPVAAPDGTGGIIVAWTDDRTGNKDVYATRFHSTGANFNIWGNLGGIAVAHTLKDEQAPRIVSDGAEGVYIAWELVYGPGDIDVMIQRLTDDAIPAPGFPATGITIANPVGDQMNIRMNRDGAAGAVLAWNDSRPGVAGSADVYAQRVSPTGSADWGTQGMRVSSGSLGESVVGVEPDPTTGSVIVWTEQGASDPQYHRAQRFSVAGAALWPAPGVTVSSLPGIDLNQVTMSDPLALWVAWDNSTFSPHRVDFVLQRVEWNGTVGSGAFGPNGLVLRTDDQGGGATHICRGGESSAIVAWSDGRGPDLDLYLQQVGTSGVRAYQSDGIAICAASDFQVLTGLLPDESGGSFQIWEDRRTGGIPNVYAYRLARPDNLVANSAGPGWTGPAVPRSDASATVDTATVSTTLPGGTVGTWLNWRVLLDGAWPVRGSTAFLAIDEEAFVESRVIPDGEVGPLYFPNINAGPYYFNGGRHSLMTVADAFGEVFEDIETDNIGRGQWVWRPPSIAREVPILRALPPNPGPWPNPNSDGFMFTRDPSAAWVTSILPLASADDYDLVVYSDYANSTNGFSNPLGFSVNGLGDADFVVGHYSATPTLLYPAAVRYDAGDAASFWFDQTDAIGRWVNSNVETSHEFTEPLGRGRCANVYEFLLNQGSTSYFALERTSGTNDLAFEIFPGTPGGVWGRGQGAAGSEPCGAACDSAAFVAPATGWYPVVVYRPRGDQGDRAVGYRLRWGFAPTADASTPETPAAELALEPVFPNPARGAVSLRLTLPRAGRARLDVFDVSGRRVRGLFDGERPAGPQGVTWNGADESGGFAGAGLYWARLTAGGRTLVRKFSVAR